MNRSIRVSFLLTFALGSAGMAASSASGSINGFDVSWCKNFLSDGGNPPLPVAGGWQITNTTQNERRSLFHPTPQDITSSFTASFTYQLTTNDTGPHGVTFCIVKTMNCPSPPLGGTNAGLGYSGIPSSKAVSILLSGGSTFVGLNTNGVIAGGPSPAAPANAYGFHPLNVTIAYDSVNQLVTVTLKDTVTQAQSAPLSFFAGNLATTIGSPTAYIGCTASTWNGSNQFLTNFLFTNVPCPADIAHNGTVNVDDLLAVINAWGPCPDCPADVNGDDSVNVDDLLVVINAWGACP